MKSSFERFAGYCAVLAGIAGFLYSVAFIILRSDVLSALFLLLGGLFGTAALTALYERLRGTDSAFALWGLLFALVGAIGSTIHRGFDLSNALHPPAITTDLPNTLDPRGLLTFGFAGIGLFMADPAECQLFKKLWLSGLSLSHSHGYSVFGSLDYLTSDKPCHPCFTGGISYKSHLIYLARRYVAARWKEFLNP